DDDVRRAEVAADQRARQRTRGRGRGGGQVILADLGVNGELRQVGNGADILINPSDDYVRRFVKDVNRSRVVKIGALAQPLVMMALQDAEYRQCQDILNRNTGIALCQDDTPCQVIAPDMVAHMSKDYISNCSVPRDPIPVLSENMCLEDCFSSFAQADGPILIHDKEGAIIGMVSLKSVVAAL
ncbi:MAG: hypothetical protein P1V34_09985, partial [Alphaproteobacteria bacterium]|nr:hypothetical protein [Alphaproteobacteria bacterium]